MIDINELMKVITHIQHKMKCFYYFRDSSSRNKNGSRRASAPELTRNCHNSSSSSEYTVAARMKKNSHDLSTSSGSVIQKSANELYEEKGGSLRSFTYSELQQSTNGFNRLQKIGEGGFGIVYKGTIRGETGGRIGVAIKKLNQEGFQGHRQWLAEVQFLGIVAHTNLVKLVGYCATDGERGIQRLLVYEYMSNGSLENHLFSKGCELLGWERRLNIMLGAAKGLAYLHEELEVQVIFRDFKTSNVLLDDNFEAKLSDFGLAREGPSPGRSHVSTTVVGTHGYAAPDYIETGHLTSKSDVWSFGVVLYEILTGRRSLERNRPRSEQKLLEWVKKYTPDSRKFSSIMDQRLEGKYSLTSAKKIAKLADSCLAKSVKERPMMSQVVEQLKGIMVGVVGDEVVECCEEVVEQEVIGEISGGGESARRRLAQLVKIGENVDSVSRRKFMIMQRVKDKVGNNGGGGGDAAKSRQNENVIVV